MDEDLVGCLMVVVGLVAAVMAVQAALLGVWLALDYVVEAVARFFMPV